MLESGTELIEINAGESYMPTKTSVDKRNGRQLDTSLSYWQIGENGQHGFSYGPVFKLELVDLANVAALGTVFYIKIWGVQNEDDTAPLWPIQHFINFPVVHVWFKKFIFTDADGIEVEVDPSKYIVIGHKKRNYPMVW